MPILAPITASTVPEDAMPFSGHSAKELQACLQSIAECSLPVEVFDAFLHNYKQTGSLGEARAFACSEWDC